MTPATRAHYFGLWVDACQAQGWAAKDEQRRRRVTLDCMVAIRTKPVDSTTKLGVDEVTALFCYLEFLKANGASLEASARWLDCQQDFRAFSRARHADWHERETYGTKKNKLDRNRFGGAASAAGEALDKFDPEQIRKRHLTTATRHRAKLQRQGVKPAASAAAAAEATERPDLQPQAVDGDPF